MEKKKIITIIIAVTAILAVIAGITAFKLYKLRKDKPVEKIPEVFEQVGEIPQFETGDGSSFDSFAVYSGNDGNVYATATQGTQYWQWVYYPIANTAQVITSGSLQDLYNRVIWEKADGTPVDGFDTSRSFDSLAVYNVDGDGLVYTTATQGTEYWQWVYDPNTGEARAITNGTLQNLHDRVTW